MNKVVEDTERLSASTKSMSENFNIISIHFTNDIISVHLESPRDLELVEGEITYCERRHDDRYPVEARKVIPSEPGRYETRFFALVRAEEKTA